MADASPTPTTEFGSTPSLVTRITRNPITGFAPWILLALLEGPLSLPVAVGISLAVSVAVTVADRSTGSTVKILSVVDVVSFATFFVIAIAAGPDVSDWLETWFGEIASVILTLVAVVSIAVRVPFTIQYAKEQTDPQYWSTPLFLRINDAITGAWAAAFFVGAVAGFYGDAVLEDPNNLWTAWLIPIVAIVAAVKFTSWYPDRATNRHDTPD